jgi:flavodoxin/NAD-dependent dihydropyrimidine dehydrogenase PreA subunit
MKSIVVYFSLTGNTKKVARAIHRGMSSLTGTCDFAQMKETDPADMDGYDLIALGAPIWGGLPPNVRLFVNALPPLEGRHMALFCTHGAWPERFFPQAMTLLENKDVTVIGMGDWYGSAFRPTLPKPYITDGHPDEKDLQEAQEFGKEMAASSQRIVAGVQSVPRFPKMPLAPPSGLPAPVPKFHHEKCTHPECRLCIEHCPMGGIDLSTYPVRFARPCATCYFCEMICPTGAIEVDYEARAQLSLKSGKERFVKRLEEAELQGRFRKLTPPEKHRLEHPLVQNPEETSPLRHY